MRHVGDEGLVLILYYHDERERLDLEELAYPLQVAWVTVGKKSGNVEVHVYVPANEDADEYCASVQDLLGRSVQVEPFRDEFPSAKVSAQAKALAWRSLWAPLRSRSDPLWSSTYPPSGPCPVRPYRPTHRPMTQTELDLYHGTDS